ncbi:alpha/beta hydrolase family protein [Streptomyces sp. NPDC004111]|uniref:alpha/beta hydrolase family protein n=1 Tax=Streptomyces sp. NPDC004111 TaxID=3364690 RepID=UPI0036A1187F
MSRNSKRNRRLVASAAAVAALALAAPAASAGAGAPDASGASGAFVGAGRGGAPAGSATARTLRLPEPTGAFAVGKQVFHLVDTGRSDPWEPAAGARELMVSVHYPARPGTGSGPAPYLGEREAEALVEGINRPDFPAATVSGARTNSRTDARPLDGRHPLVVLSPGFTLHRGTLTVLAEELASRGYVVALVDHAYESFGTTFPGDRTLPCTACDGRITGRVPEGRAADVSFLLDRLLGGEGELGRAFGNRVDARRIGMAGHSIGGNSAAVAMARDPRIKAGANLDGGFFDDLPGAGMDGRPFLLLGTDATHRPDGGGKWREAWGRMDGWKRWLTVAGTGHFSFNDVPVLGGQAGVVDPGAPLSGKRSGEITVTYTGAFFDRHLRGMRAPVLDGPTADNPEVTFHAP